MSTAASGRSMLCLVSLGLLAVTKGAAGTFGTTEFLEIGSWSDSLDFIDTTTASSETPAPLSSKSTTRLPTTTKSLSVKNTIPADHELESSQTEEPLFASTTIDDVTVEVTTVSPAGPDIFAVLAGGAYTNVLYGTNHTFDALTFTVDRNNPGSSDGLQFTWQCRRECESWAVYDSTYTTVVTNMSSFCSNTTETPGCLLNNSLNDGTGTIEENTSGFYMMDTSKFIFDKSLYMRVIVKKESSTSVDSQIVMLLGESTPVIELDCLNNCWDHLNPNERLTLSASVTSSNESFIWYWDLFNGTASTTLSPVPNNEWLPYVSTGVGTRHLVISSDYWLIQSPEATFTVAVYAVPYQSYDEKDVGVAYYSAVLSGPILSPNCSVNPTQGVALTNEFNMSCGDFLTDNMPLTYKIGYTVDDQTYIWIGLGSDLVSLGMGLSLPLGLVSFGGLVNVTVKGTDAIGLQAMAQAATVVGPPSAEDLNNVLSLLTSFDPTVGINFSDPGAALQFIGALAVTLNNLNLTGYGGNGSDSSSLADQLTAAREAMTSILAQLPLNDVDSVLTVQSVLCSVLNEPTQVSDNARQNAAGILERSADFLSGLATTTMSETQLHNVVEGMLATADVLLSANTYAASSSNDSQPSDHQDISGRVIAVFDVLAGALLSTMVPGDSSRIIRSNTIAMVAGKLYSSLIDKGPVGDVEEGNTMAIPSVSVSTTNSTDETVTNLQFNVFTQSPFISKSADINIGSDVMTMKLSLDDGGGASNVQNLNKPVHILTNLSPVPDQSTTILSGIAAAYRQIKVETQRIFFLPNISILLTFDWFRHLSKANHSEILSTVSDNTSLFVYMSVDRIPSRRRHDFNCTLPIELSVNSTTNETTVVRGGAYSSFCPSHGLSNDSGTPCQGYNIYDDSNLFPFGDVSAVDRKLCYIPGSLLRMNGTYLNIRVRHIDNADLDESESPWKESWSSLGNSAINNSIIYNASMVNQDCRLWDRTNKIWQTNGCLGGPLGSLTVSHCICNPISANSDASSTNTTTQRARRSTSDSSGAAIAFGSGLTISVNAPNLQDSAFNHLDDNPLIFSVMVSIICIYMSVLVWTIHRDRIDDYAAGVHPLIDNRPEDTYLYEVTVCTGNVLGAGTSAKVFMVFSGEHVETHPRIFYSKERPIFKRGDVDTFVMTTPQSIGSLSYIRIWHDNSGVSPSWYLNRVTVVDLQTGQKFYFVVNKWLSETDGDCLRYRVINVAGKADLTGFSNAFWIKTRKDLFDGHLWFSVLGRPLNSRFSRTQRCTCCITLLFSLMTANILFYNKIIKGNLFIKIGTFSISVGQIVQGVIASFIVLPINLLVVQIFRKAGTFESWKSAQRRKKQVRNDHSTPSLQRSIAHIDFQNEASTKPSSSHLPLPSCNGGSRAASYAKTVGLVHQKALNSNRKSKKTSLPWWCVFVAYFLCLVTCGVAFWYVVEIGGTLGQEASAKWLVAFITSVIESIILSQPIKVIIKAIFITMVFKKPAHDDEPASGSGKRLDYLDKHFKESEKINVSFVEDIRRKMSMPQPPEINVIRQVEQKRQISQATLSVLKEIGLYSIFVAVMMTMSYGNLDANCERAYRALENNFRFGLPLQNSLEPWSLDNVHTAPQLWNWLAKTLIPSTTNDVPTLSDGAVGNSTVFPYSEFVLAKQVRLRQFRLGRDISCGLSTDNRSCYGDSLSQPEDTGIYGDEWTPATNKSYSIDDAWRWTSDVDGGGYKTVGRVGVYPGSGYIWLLGNTTISALAAVRRSESLGWIDRKTRGVSIEFAMYNPNVNFLAVSFILFEILPIGVVKPIYQMNFLRYEPYGRENIVTLVAEVGCFLLVCFFTYHEFNQVKGLKRKYFKSVGHMLDMTNLFMCYVAIALFITKISTLEEAKWHFTQQQSTDFVNFQAAAYWNEWYRSFLGLTSFFTTVKFLKLLRFNNRVNTLTATIQAVIWPLLSFMVVLLIIFIGFAHMTCLIYGGVLEYFSSFTSTCLYLLILMLNKFDYLEIQQANPYFAPILIVGFAAIINFLMLNVMMTIIMEGFADTQRSWKGKRNKHEILQFMLEQFKVISGIGLSHAQSQVRSTKDNLEKKRRQAWTKSQALSSDSHILSPTLQPKISAATSVSEASKIPPAWLSMLEDAGVRLDKAVERLTNPSAAKIIIN